MSFKYINFVYWLKLPVLIASDLGGGKGRRLKQPGYAPIPSGTKEFILGLNNPDADGMNTTTRIDNEVAIISLSSSAPRHLEPNVVPRVFGYEAFNSMNMDQKRNTLAQMAALLKALHALLLPESLTGWGGMAVDDSGRI